MKETEKTYTDIYQENISMLRTFLKQYEEEDEEQSQLFWDKIYDAYLLFPL